MVEQRKKYKFTLNILLIIVIIVSVIVAVAIPFFTEKLDNIRQSAKTSNVRPITMYNDYNNNCAVTNGIKIDKCSCICNCRLN